MLFSRKAKRYHKSTKEVLFFHLAATTHSPMIRSQRYFSSLLSPLRLYNFRLLFVGQLISNIGDMFYAVALPWFILSNGGGAQTLSMVLVAYGISRASSTLLGGILSDRLRPRRVMLFSDSLRALLVGVLAWLALVGHPASWLLSLIMAFLGLCAGLFLPASFSTMPDVLPEADLQAGNALGATSTQLAILVGPALAGLIVSRFQPAAGLALDAFSFVVSAVTLVLMRSKRPSARLLRTPSPSDTSKTKAGNASAEFAPPHTFLQFLRTSHFLHVILVLMVLGNFIGGGVGTVAISIFVHTFLKAGTTGYGLIISAFGLGALVGGISTGSLGRLPRRGVLVQLIWFIQAVAITLIPFAGIAFGVAGAALASAIEGLTNSLGNITFRTIIQQHLPRHLLGRISGVFAFCQFSLYPLSVAIAGLMVVHWGPLSVFLADGVVGFFALVYGLSQGEIREI